MLRGPQAPPYTRKEAQRIFQRAFKEGAVILTHHGRLRMRQRGIDTNDLLALARSGTVFNPPEPDIKTDQWKYLIERPRPRLKAVFIIEEQRKVRILTVQN